MGSADADDGRFDDRPGGAFGGQRGAVDGLVGGTKFSDQAFAHAHGGLDAMAAIAKDAVGDFGYQGRSSYGCHSPAR